MRISCRSVIFKDNQVVLIYRERDGEQYYVFPGGKIENNETKEECIVRECKEELGLEVSVNKYIYEVKGEDFIQHFFLCNWLSGEIGTGDEEEYQQDRKGGLQVPMLINIEDLSKLNIVSPPIIKQLLEDINNHGLMLDNDVKTIIEG